VQTWRHPVSIDISRLRAGEVAAGLSGGALLLSWARRREAGVLPWLSLITGVSALALPYTQATRRAPAVPVALSVVVTALSGTTAVGLLRRMLFRSGATRLGLCAALGVAAGAYASMRQESGTDLAELGELETITLEP
jgi:hypothetical protein